MVVALPRDSRIGVAHFRIMLSRDSVSLSRNDFFIASEEAFSTKKDITIFAVCVLPGKIHVLYIHHASISTKKGRGWGSEPSLSRVWARSHRCQRTFVRRSNPSAAGAATKTPPGPAKWRAGQQHNFTITTAQTNFEKYKWKELSLPLVDILERHCGSRRTSDLLTA